MNNRPLTLHEQAYDYWIRANQSLQDEKLTHAINYNSLAINLQSQIQPKQEKDFANLAKYYRSMYQFLEIKREFCLARVYCKKTIETLEYTITDDPKCAKRHDSYAELAFSEKDLGALCQKLGELTAAKEAYLEAIRYGSLAVTENPGAKKYVTEATNALEKVNADLETKKIQQLNNCHPYTSSLWSKNNNKQIEPQTHTGQTNPLIPPKLTH